MKISNKQLEYDKQYSMYTEVDNPQKSHLLMWGSYELSAIVSISDNKIRVDDVIIEIDDNEVSIRSLSRGQKEW